MAAAEESAPMEFSDDEKKEFRKVRCRTITHAEPAYPPSLTNVTSED